MYAAYAVLKAPAKRIGAAALLAVLTCSTFLFTNNVYVGFGATSASAIALDADGTHIDPETKLNKTHQALFVLLAGLIVVDVANVLTMLTIVEEDGAAPAKAAEPEAPKDVEATA